MSRTILVAYDFSPIAEQALAWAGELARESGRALALLHVQVITPPVMGPDAVMPMPMPTADDTEGARQRLAAVAARAGAAGGADVVTAVNVGAAVVEHARRVGADMIVTGTHGRSGVARAFVGSVADHIVRHAECPVVTLRGRHA